MKSDWFVINNLKEFIDSSRALVFNNFGKEDSEESSTEDVNSLLNIDAKDKPELDNVLNYEECLTIAKQMLKKQKHKTTKEIRYILNDKCFYKIIMALNDRMVSNILNNLVNIGLVESAFDDKQNDFVFWVKKDK